MIPSEDTVRHYLRRIVSCHDHTAVTSERLPRSLRVLLGTCALAIAVYAMSSVHDDGWGPRQIQARWFATISALAMTAAAAAITFRGIPRHSRTVMSAALFVDLAAVTVLATFHDTGEALAGVAVLGIASFAYVFLLPWTAFVAHLTIAAAALIAFTVLALLGGTSPSLVAARVIVVTLTALVLPSAVRLLWGRLWSIARDGQFDPLTGTLNRRGLDTHVLRRLRRTRPTDALAVAIVDLDHFKFINDSYGHAAGDDVLRAVTAALTDATDRTRTLLARTGGDEFTLVLTGDLPQVDSVISALPSAVPRGATHPHVTMSIGVALAHRSHDQPPTPADLDQLRRTADHAMYLAKANGGNAIRRTRAHLLPAWNGPTDAGAAGADNVATAITEPLRPRTAREPAFPHVRRRRANRDRQF